jgi:putative oxidoreductase
MTTDVMTVSVSGDTHGNARLWTVRVLRVLVAAAFAAAGTSKLAGVPAMVQLFDVIGLGQWFRYVTGIVEIAGAVALLLSPYAVLGAIWLGATMFFATLTHLFVLHTSPAPALVLLALSAVIMILERQQLKVLIARFN